MSLLTFLRTGLSYNFVVIIFLLVLHSRGIQVSLSYLIIGYCYCYQACKQTYKDRPMTSCWREVGTVCLTPLLAYCVKSGCRARGPSQGAGRIWTTGGGPSLSGPAPLTWFIDWREAHNEEKETRGNFPNSSRNDFWPSQGDRSKWKKSNCFNVQYLN